MSHSPHGLGWNSPTGEVNGWPSSQDWKSHPPAPPASNIFLAEASSTLAWPSRLASASPHQKRVVVPARQACSHCASVGRPYVFFSFALNHSQNLIASYHVRFTAGSSSVCGKPGSRQVYFGPA